MHWTGVMLTEWFWVIIYGYSILLYMWSGTGCRMQALLRKRLRI